MAADSDRKRLLEILLERSFKLGDFTLSSGRKSDYYVDCRTTTLHPEGAKLITKLIMPILEEWNVEQVGGLTLGADPIVSTISMAASGVSWGDGEKYQGDPIPAFIVRKEEKAHGTGRRIEGCFEEGKPTAIIEDTLTTGGSALKAVEAAQQAGAEVVGVIAVVDREEGGREAVEAEGLPLKALFTATELKEAARAKEG